MPHPPIPVVVEYPGGAVTFRPIWPTLGAAVEGVDLCRPVSPELASVLADAFVVYHALLFEDQRLEPADEEAAMSIFDIVAETGVYGHSFRIEGHPAIRVLSNIVEGEKRLGIVMGKQGPEWHVDGTSAQEAPIASQLYCIEANDVGGDTLFANAHLAFETLPAPVRERVDGLTATYNSDHLQRKLAVYDNRPLDLTGAPDARWPIVAAHPVTGRKALQFSGGDMVSIDGVPEDERLELIATFTDHLFTYPHLAYQHRWRPGDLFVWDNRSVLHSATTYNYDGHPRLLHHLVGSGMPAPVPTA